QIARAVHSPPVLRSRRLVALGGERRTDSARCPRGLDHAGRREQRRRELRPGIRFAANDRLEWGLHLRPLARPRGAPRGRDRGSGRGQARARALRIRARGIADRRLAPVVRQRVDAGHRGGEHDRSQPLSRSLRTAIDESRLGRTGRTLAPKFDESLLGFRDRLAVEAEFGGRVYLLDQYRSGAFATYFPGALHFQARKMRLAVTG